jgi:hypothetical protein
VLLLSPDYTNTDTDVSFITGIFAGFSDVTTTWWDTGTGAPTGSDLLPYDVVVIGNRTPWSLSAASAAAVGNALADYVDGGGKVVETNFVHDYYVSTYTWYLEGRYVTDGYGPFTASTTDDSAAQTATIIDSGHPLMSSVSSLTETTTSSLIINPGLATGADLIATWSPSGWNAVAASADGSIVGLNMCIFSASEAGGDVGVLLHNAIVWLVEGE